MPKHPVSACEKGAGLSPQSINDPFTSRYSKAIQQFDVLPYVTLLMSKIETI